MSVTFETKVWENDWQLIMRTSRLKDTIIRCFYNFNKRVLYINNVNNLSLVKQTAYQLIDEGIIDKFVNVDDFSDTALDYFNLNRNKLGKGYYYSIAELVSIYLTETNYLLHFSGDTTLLPKISNNWLGKGINILDHKSEVMVFNLTWNNNYDLAKNESEYEDNDFFYGYGFSDQMYLIRTADFKQCIYEYYDTASERYPKYGGELFEKRVDSWMRQHNYLRATYKHGSYIHKNFTKNNFLKRVSIYLNKPNLLG